MKIVSLGAVLGKGGAAASPGMRGGVSEFQVRDDERD
jgi:hypothetical protein